MISLLGQGGMGAVFVAEQERPLRRVALKLMRAGVASERALRRFEHEAEILGRLVHPGIAQIYEAGLSDGVPYFAMELVEGRSLLEYCAGRNLGTRERLALFAKICDAVHHAHTKGVVHRDLKPGNILVAEAGQPPEPQPKILDFGVARVTDSDIRSTTMRTDVGQIIGTLPYMSPEQVGGENEDLDTRSDVYSLGVVLYELLAGKMPYDLERRMIHEAARIIREDEPTRLSSVDTRLRGDVETIVGRAMEKARERRYQSALDLGGDIRRYLADEPIMARPPSAGYQFAKFAARNKAVVGGVVAVIVALAGGVVGTGIALDRALRAESGLKEQLGQTEAARKDLASSNESLAASVKRAEIAEGAERKRADELERVASFQAEQLKIDPSVMATRMREDMVSMVRERAAKEGLGEAEIGERVEAFERQLAGLDLTGMAQRGLDATIFERSQAAIHAEFADQPLVRARLLLSLAISMRDLGLGERAIPMHEEACALLTEARGPDHPDTLAAVHALGQTYSAMERADVALPFLREAWEGRVRALGEAHTDTLVSLTSLGAAEAKLGKLAEARATLERVIAARVAAFGSADREIPLVKSSLGIVLRELGDLEASEAMLREALAEMRAAYGDDDPQTITTIDNLGRILRFRARYAEAEVLHGEAMERGRRVFGELNPVTLMAYNNLALAIREKGDLAAAEPMFRDLIAAMRRGMGDDYIGTITGLMNLGGILQARGDLDGALPILAEADERCDRVLGPDHPQAIAARNNLALLHLATGRASEAEPLLRDVFERRLARFGPDHPSTVTSKHNMGAVLRELGRMEESRAFLADALVGREKAVGPNHPTTLATMNTYGVVLREMGSLEEALAIQTDLVARARGHMPAGHPDIGLYLGHTGRTLAMLARYPEAEPLMVEAVAELERSRGTGDRETLRFGVWVAELYEAWERAEPGKGHDRTAAEWRARAPAPAAPGGP